MSLGVFHSKESSLRPDLNKLLCEHERHHSWDGFNNYRHNREFKQDLNDLLDDEHFGGVSGGHRESMKYRYGYDTKEFGENFAPLWGFIRKSVNRPWDKVYSELCSVFDKRSVINQHILTHLDDFVERKDVYEGFDGQLYIHSNYGTDRPLKGSGTEYYVDPRDGILKLNTRRVSYDQQYRQREAARKRAELAVKRVVNKDIELHNIDGTWFEVKFEHFKPRTTMRFTTPSQYSKPYLRAEHEYPYKFDVLQKKTVQTSKVATSKRTLSHKELKKYGVV